MDMFLITPTFDSRINYIYFVISFPASLLISEDIELSPSYVLHIRSPGYPKVNYKSKTIYTWNVTAPAETKEILIDINMDIIRPSRGLCEDYLKVCFSFSKVSYFGRWLTY